MVFVKGGLTERVLVRCILDNRLDRRAGRFPTCRTVSLIGQTGDPFGATSHCQRDILALSRVEERVGIKRIECQASIRPRAPRSVEFGLQFGDGFHLIEQPGGD